MTVTASHTTDSRQQPAPSGEGPAQQTLSREAARFLDDVQRNRVVLRVGGGDYNKEAVSWLQRKLGAEVTGTYDEQTASKVREFQKENFIFNTSGGRVRLAVDGVCGPRTFRSLIQNDPSFAKETGLSLLAIEEFAMIINNDWDGYDGGGTSRSRRGRQVSCNLPNDFQLSQASKYVAISAEEIAQSCNMTIEQARNVRAMLGLISWAEGTAHENGYGTRFGGGQFDYNDGHPGTSVRRGRYNSSACGKYQFLCSTWNSVAGGSMEPKKQDLAAIELIRRRGVLDDVMRGDLDSALPKLAYEWASLPKHAGDTYGGYGQSVKSYTSCMNLFNRLQTI